jgi:DNA-binding XRE family transcriptional regulator
MRIDEVFAEIEAENPGILDYSHEVDPPVILAANVLRVRTERGMTQAQLAEAIGVAQPRIAEVERGDANPRLSTLSKIAHALGITLSELLEDNLYGNSSSASAAGPSAQTDMPGTRKRRVG